MAINTAVLLINLGTPDRPTRVAVGKFLSEFLGDGRILDLPYIFRKLLVNLVIVPFRAGKSAKMYRKVWSENGSPILYNTQRLADKLQQKSTDKCEVFMAMRYGRPSLDAVLSEIEQRKFGRLIIVPLFPHYASATSGTIIEKTLRLINRWDFIPGIKIISGFYKDPLFIKAWTEKIRKANFDEYDHILFSYHGLPERHVERTHQNRPCSELNCTFEINAGNQGCYRAQCYEHTRIIAGALKLPDDKYTVCFQSRFGKRWLSPFTEDLTLQKAKSGIKKLMIVPMSFVADCLETIVEIDMEYRELFIANDGEKFKMVESLNADDLWVESLKSMTDC